MTRLLAVTLVCLALGACGVLKPLDLARMPPGTYGPGVDVDDGAIYNAETVFLPDGPLPSDPSTLALALASVEYLGGEYNAGGRWGMVNGMVGATMDNARQEIRRTLGISPEATSQQVVNTLLALHAATTETTRLAALTNPIYTLGARATLDRLRAMPPLPLTRTAVQYASHHLYDDLDLPL
jgi:hypothetical protein